MKNVQVGDMVRVLKNKNLVRIGWVRRVTAKRITVEESNGMNRRSYAHKNIEIIQSVDPRAGMFQEDVSRVVRDALHAGERKRLRERMANDGHSTVRDGILYWNSNDAIVPPFVFRDAGYLVPAAQQAAYDKDSERLLAAYRRAQENMSAEARAEQAFEMRAAFGPGVDVVDVFTGRKVRT